jgi:hypothetical protein
MPGPKVYGTPTGYQPPNPQRQQKAATPATDAQVDAYMKHMIQADQAYHAKAGSAPAARPRGSSSYNPDGSFKQGKGQPPIRVEKAIKDAGG